MQMKKLKIETKLNLNKVIIKGLNKDEAAHINGGGIISIGWKCTQYEGGCSTVYRNLSKGLFCNDTRATLCTY